MCGIAGICPAGSRDPSLLERRARRMADTLVHRGPDEAGIHVTPRVALASRRLKVIDLETGRMPISNEDGSVVVVYNGEIYNHRSLRAELEAAGHRFRTRSDTEVLVHLYEEHGIDLVHRLRGMFAFALWDDPARSLYLVRDRLGIKPLHFRRTPHELLFGSELGSLTAGADTEPDLDVGALAEFLALGYIRDPRSIYRDHEKLPPGTIARYRDGEVQTWRYWEYPSRVETPDVTPEGAVEELHRLLREAVRERLVADVPLGAFLSGGVDSSIVVALAAEQVSGRLETFSVGFGRDDELAAARQVSDIFHTRHHELRLDAGACDILDRLLDSFGEPFGDASSVPTYYVSELARRHVTVSLSGDGGDELFGGYDRYAHDARWAWVDRIPDGLRNLLFGLPHRMLPRGAYGWNRLESLSVGRQDRYSLFMTEDLDYRRGGLLHPRFYEDMPDRLGLLSDLFEEASELPPSAQLMYVDANSYLPGDILTKVDRMSMAHSLEARVPLLDHRLVEFAARLPPGWKIRDGERKWLLKQVGLRHLPREILRRPKQGFSLPVHDWLRDDLSDRLDGLLARDAASGRYLYRPAVERLVDEHRRGRRNHADLLWRLLVLEAWLRGQERTGADRPAGRSLSLSRHA